jgi:hypothetical protein
VARKPNLNGNVAEQCSSLRARWTHEAETCREKEGVNESTKKLHIDGQKQLNKSLPKNFSYFN